jgi:UDP-glucose 6-dehydrogenase
MKKSVVLAAVMLAATGAAVAAFNPAARAGEQVCVHIRDLGNLKPIDDSTLLATTRNQGNFIVKLRNPCRDFRQIDNYYKVRVVSQQECFDGDDVLEFRYGGLCFVESVTPAQK